MERIASKLTRFRRRADRGPWSESRLQQVRDQVLVDVYRSGLFR